MRAAHKFLLPLLGVLLALALAEGAVRSYFAAVPAPERSSYVPDPDTGYRLRPGPFWEDGRDPADVINSLGFRDREHPRKKPPGTFRIVGIGDSFVLGAVPIERNFLRLLEQMWNDSVASGRRTRPAGNGPERAEVMLMGLGGYSPENEVGVLRAAALPADPDLVVLCFYVGNDVTGIGLRGEVLGGELYYVDSPNPLHRLLRRSRLFVVLEKGIVTRWRHANIQRQRERGAVTGVGDPETEAGPTLYYKLIVKKRLPVYARATDRETERLWARSEAAIAEFDRLCRAAGVPWLLMLIPGEEQVDATVRGQLLHALGADSSDYDFDLPQRRLLAFARSRRLWTVDLLPEFRARSSKGERLYIPNDTHWNATGNERAAEALLFGPFMAPMAKEPTPPDP